MYFAGIDEGRTGISKDASIHTKGQTMSTNNGWLITALLVFGAGLGVFANGIQIFLNQYFRAPFTRNIIEGRLAQVTGGVLAVAGVAVLAYSGYLFWTRIILFL